jgi:hypothetical protein
MNYLEIARRALTGYEKDERDEKGSKSPAPVPAMRASPSVADGELARDGVDRGPVEASVPPPEWDGVVPTGCGVPVVCSRLGPCPIFAETHVCWACSGSPSGRTALI